jgi:hypothetical protein
MTCSYEMNNSLQRTGERSGRTVRAVALCARAGGRPFNGIFRQHEQKGMHVHST